MATQKTRKKRKGESVSLVDLVEREIASSEQGNFINFFRIKDAGATTRVRFLTDFTTSEVLLVPFHYKFGDDGYEHPCLRPYGLPCPNCDKPVSNRFVLLVWNYELSKVQIFMYKASKSTPIEHIAEIYHQNGTITDCDMVIKRIATGTATRYSVTQMEKKPFKKNIRSEMEPFSTPKKIRELIKQTFTKYGPDAEIEMLGSDDDEDEDDDIIDRAIKGRSVKSSKSKRRTYVQDDDDEDEDDDVPFDIDDDEDYDDDDYDDEDDEEEEELPPPKKVKKSKKSEGSKKNAKRRK